MDPLTTSRPYQSSVHGQHCLLTMTRAKWMAHRLVLALAPFHVLLQKATPDL
jgi:hypothetical protein